MLVFYHWWSWCNFQASGWLWWDCKPLYRVYVRPFVQYQVTGICLATQNEILSLLHSSTHWCGTLCSFFVCIYSEFFIFWFGLWNCDDRKHRLVEASQPSHLWQFHKFRSVIYLETSVCWISNAFSCFLYWSTSFFPSAGWCRCHNSVIYVNSGESGQLFI